ncbi:MAG: formate dehydrogenase accessory protein FdhE [bacterium]
MEKQIVEQMRKRIVELKETRNDLVDALDLYSKIIEIGAQVDPSEIGEPLAAPAEAAKGPYPFFDLATAKINWTAAAPAFKKMCALFCEEGQTEPDVEKAKNADAKEAGEMLATAFARFVFMDRQVTPENPDAASAQLAFVAFLTMRNYIGRLVGEGRKLLDNQEGVYEATCPLCGGKPLMSKLVKEEGFRHLVCGICESDWLFTRLKCSNCGNTDHKTVGLIVPENIEDPYSVFTCDECKHYLKIIDTRKYKHHVDSLFEAIATAHWDYIAQNRGFKSSATWVGMTT